VLSRSLKRQETEDRRQRKIYEISVGVMVYPYPEPDRDEIVLGRDEPYAFGRPAKRPYWNICPKDQLMPVFFSNDFA